MKKLPTLTPYEAQQKSEDEFTHTECGEFQFSSTEEHLDGTFPEDVRVEASF